MSESVQTSIEQINLIAAQLRYKIESTLQFNSQLNLFPRNSREEKLQEVGATEIFSDSQPCQVISAAAFLENDFLHREVLEFKQIVEKQAQQLKSKESTLKLCKDGLKQERIAKDMLRRENKQISADAKANERYVKCLQIEYELLRSMTTKSQEAFHLIGGESIKQVAELEKTAKMLKKQTKELVEIHSENKMLREEVVRLNSEITRQRAAAGVTNIAQKKFQLEIERLADRERRLDSRASSLTERLDKERHINTLLSQTVEEAELKATTAFDGIAAASQQQVGLLKRLQHLGEEVVHLRDLVSKEQPADNIVARTNTRENMYESPVALQDNSNKGIVTEDRVFNSDSAIVGREELTKDKNEFTTEISENFLMALSADDDAPYSNIAISDVSVRDNIKADGRGSEWIDANRNMQHDQDVIDAARSFLKRARAAEDNEELITDDFLKVRPPRLEDEKKSIYTSPSSNTSSTSIKSASSAMEAESVDLDDERCPACLDTPYGLMVLCKVCRRGLHSACAKKGGGGTYTGKEFKCTRCSNG